MGNCACEKEGTYNYPNGDYFKGALKNDVPSGKGILYYKNGDIKYDGEFVKGKKQGLGKYYFSDYNWYVWEDGKKFYFLKGDYYFGQFLNDSMHGKGIIYLSNGTIKYDGDFENNKFNGVGKYYFDKGGYYIGQLKDDMQHGKGKMYDKNGNIWLEGEFVNDHLNGIGKLYFESGYYISQFVNDKMVGKGKLYSNNGTLIGEFYYVNGKMVSAAKKENNMYNFMKYFDDRFHGFL